MFKDPCRWWAKSLNLVYDPLQDITPRLGYSSSACFKQEKNEHCMPIGTCGQRCLTFIEVVTRLPQMRLFVS